MRPERSEEAVIRQRAVWRGKALKVVRRVHLVAGVLLFPWVALYGLSGFFFNHPTLGVESKGRPLSTEELASFDAGKREPSLLASELVAQLNADESLEGRPFEVASSYAPQLDGINLLLGVGERDVYQLMFDAAEGRAVLVTRAKGETPPGAPFSGKQVSLPQDELASVARRFSGALGRLGLEDVPLKPRGIAQELRFRLVDAYGRQFEASYHLGKRQLDGKPVGGASGLTFSQAIQRLHMNHHYPRTFGPLFLWALFQDLSGLTLILWAATGLVMAFSVRAVRLVVIVSVVVAVLVCAFAWSGTFDEITFGHVSAINGPGDR